MRAQLRRLAARAASAPRRALDAFERLRRRSWTSSRCCAPATSSAPRPGHRRRSRDRDAARRAAPAADNNRELAVRSDRISWIGTVAVMVLLVVGLTALSALLDRAGRRRLRDDHLRRLAFEDSLTGLPNRSLFEQRIAATLAAGEPAVVAFLDLDDFKQVNDSLGHAAGDRLLEICGERLRNALRAGDTVARLGGDEFAILALEVTDLDAFVDRIFSVLAAPVMLEGKRLYLRASIGVATTESGHELLRNADLAMYAAKAAGTNRCAFFTEDMHINAVERLDRREQLERAIENEELRLHYQPIVDLDLGRVAGFEALVRWQHPMRGFLGPGEFIPLAEETGLIVPLGPLGPARGRPPGGAVGGRAVSERERRGRPARAAGLRRRGRRGVARRRPGRRRGSSWRSPSPRWSATSRPSACRPCAAWASAWRSTTSAPATRP